MVNKKMNFAAIDIGSNAVRLLIKSVAVGAPPSEMSKALLVRIPLRLGEEVFERGAVSASKEKRLLRTIKAFRLLMKVYDVTTYRACATSAMRDASNGERIARDIHNKTGIRLEIIDGIEEARIVYDSHIADVFDRKGHYIYVDVGGGSTEISLIAGGELADSHSYDIGTVRLLKGKVEASAFEKMERDLDELALRYPGLKIIGSGGNINKLLRMGEGAGPGELSVESLRGIYEKLKDKTVEQRMEEFGLNPDRADVIIPASEIFLDIAGRLGAESIYVPSIGIADGIAHNLYTRYLSDMQDDD